MGTLRFMDDPTWRHVGSPQYPDHDENGFCNELTLAASKYILTGSSHVYGTNLVPVDTWPIRLQREGVPIYSASMGAWSLMQFALVSQTYLKPFHRKLVVSIYLGFDVYATLKQSIDVRNASLFGFVRDGDLKLGMDWRPRQARDEAVKKARELGANLEEALRQAFDLGLQDCMPVIADGAEWWIEPHLRLQTTDLSSPYMRRAFELCRSYLDVIQTNCTERGVELEILLIPTKEAAVFHRAVGQQRGGFDGDALVDAERRLAREFACHLSAAGVRMTDLWNLYATTPVGDLFDPIPLEGHPGAKGAAAIAQWVKREHFGP